MTKEMWTNGKRDRVAYTRIPGLNFMMLACIGISTKRNESANEAQKAKTAPGQPLESGKDRAKMLDFIDEVLVT